MNPLTNVRNVQRMNEKELQQGVCGTKSSWHYIYKDSAWVFIGGLPYDLTEGDVIAVFSQYGEIVNLHLARDKSTGKSKGFCFLCYEDQRSTILAVDNLNSFKILGRVIRVDHCDNYKMPKEHEEDDDITREVRQKGVAPQPIIMDVGGDEEDRKSKKEKKKKKKKEKKLKKEKKKKESSSSESSDSEEEDVKVKKEKHDAGYERYAHAASAGEDFRRKDPRDIKTEGGRRPSKGGKEVVRGREWTHERSGSTEREKYREWEVQREREHVEYREERRDVRKKRGERYDSDSDNSPARDARMHSSQKKQRHDSESPVRERKRERHHSPSPARERRRGRHGSLSPSSVKEKKRDKRESRSPRRERRRDSPKRGRHDSRSPVRERRKERKDRYSSDNSPVREKRRDR